LIINNLNVGYSSKILLSNLNLSANKGELISLIGMNGTGKSTFLKTLMKLLPAAVGEISLFEKNISQYSRKEWAKNLSFVSTELPAVNFLKVYEVVAAGRFPHTNHFGNLSETDKFFIDKALITTKITHLKYRNFNEISDGEKQKTLIARTLAQNTPFILLDEPTAFLDIVSKFDILLILKQLTNQENKTVIFSSHDLSVVLQIADKIWLIHNNTILEAAPEDLILQNIFSNLFSDNSMFFDEKDGNFKFSHPKPQFVNLISDVEDEKIFFWTQKSLQRIDFQIDKNSEKKIFIKKNSEKKYFWNFENQNFFSIYELIKNLKINL